MFVQILVSLVFISLAIEHAFFSFLKIDIITIILIVIAFLPWLNNLIQSIELPGGMKLQLRDFKKIEEKAEKAGLLEKVSLKGLEIRNTKEAQYSFQLVEDPNLILAGLRIEIEKRLKAIAEKHQISSDRKGIKQLLSDLSSQGLLSKEEQSALNDLTIWLNNAVHGAKVDYEMSQWATGVGLRILKVLDRKI